MSLIAKTSKLPSIITKEQMELIIQSHKKLQDCIDLTNYLRAQDTGKEINFFQRFIDQSKKCIE